MKIPRFDLVKKIDCRAFTLVEMLVVIAIMSILVTAGAVGLSGIGGKGVTSGVSAAEALFDEARSTAIGKNLRACILVADKLTNNPLEDRRRIIVAFEETETDKTNPNFGQAKAPLSASPRWELSSRGILLPEKTYFSEKFSRRTKAGQRGESGDNLNTISDSQIVSAKPGYRGRYFIYQFNSQGILQDYDGGASFIIGTGSRVTSRPADSSPPRTVSEAKLDFGGFAIWRNGQTSVFRTPDQMKIPSSVTTF